MSQNAWSPSGVAMGAAQPQGYGQPPQQQQLYGAAPQGQGFVAPQLGVRPPSAAAAKGFLMGLVDFSFTSFVATKVLKVLYGLWLVAVVLGMLGGVYQAFYRAFFAYYSDIGEGMLMLVLVPIGGAAAVVVGRIYFELIIVLFRIAENLTEMNRKMKEA